MSLTEDLKSGVSNILRTKWDSRQGNKVPETTDLALAGGAVQFEGTVLYADLAQSSQLATEFHRRTAAKVVKHFLFCCSKIITAHGGKVTSFDGDRVMGVFIGKYKNTSAVKTALKIEYAVQRIIKPKLTNHFQSMNESPYEIGHAVGVDTSNILAVRAGQRGSNDLVWIGRAPNFAAKLSSVRQPPFSSYISKAVFSRIHESAKYGGDDNQLMWQRCSYTWLGREWTVYRSSWWWEP